MRKGLGVDDWKSFEFGGRWGDCNFFLIWGYLNTTSLHISCKNFTDLSYAVSFPYISVSGLVAVLKKYLIFFALWHGLMNLGWVSLGNIRSFLTTEKSPRHSFLSDFSKTTHKLRPQGAYIRQEKKAAVSHPDLGYVWVRNVLIAQSRWVFKCPYCANYECFECKLWVQQPLFIIFNCLIYCLSLFTIHLWESQKARPVIIFNNAVVLKPWLTSSSDFSFPQNLYCF